MRVSMGSRKIVVVGVYAPADAATEVRARHLEWALKSVVGAEDDAVERRHITGGRLAEVVGAALGLATALLARVFGATVVRTWIVQRA